MMWVDNSQQNRTEATSEQKGQALGIVMTCLALAAVGAIVAVQWIRERRLSKPELTRLKFYRYLRERGRLES